MCLHAIDWFLFALLYRTWIFKFCLQRIEFLKPFRYFIEIFISLSNLVLFIHSCLFLLFLSCFTSPPSCSYSCSYFIFSLFYLLYSLLQVIPVHNMLYSFERQHILNSLFILDPFQCNCSGWSYKLDFWFHSTSGRANSWGAKVIYSYIYIVISKTADLICLLLYGCRISIASL